MKIESVFIVLTIFCLGAAAWWFAGSQVTEYIVAGFSGLTQMGEEVFQGLLDSAGDAISLPLELG